MQAKRLWVLMLGLFITAFFFCGGCSVAKKPVPPQPVPNQTQPVQPQPVPNQTQTGSTDNDKAGRIARAVDQISGVKKSTVVVEGNKAYVGLDVNRNIKENQTKGLEDAVVTKIKNAESSINTVYVTTDKGIVTQVKDIAKGIGSGRIVTDFDKTLKEIEQKINPRTM